jgi:hypothetical protein
MPEISLRVILANVGPSSTRRTSRPDPKRLPGSALGIPPVPSRSDAVSGSWRPPPVSMTWTACGRRSAPSGPIDFANPSPSEPKRSGRSCWSHSPKPTASPCVLRHSRPSARAKRRRPLPSAVPTLAFPHRQIGCKSQISRMVLRGRDTTSLLSSNTGKPVVRPIDPFADCAFTAFVHCNKASLPQSH